MAELAVIYQVTDQTIWKLIKQGDLMALKVGGQWRITDKALEEYERNVRSRCFAPDPDAAAGS